MVNTNLLEGVTKAHLVIEDGDCSISGLPFDKVQEPVQEAINSNATDLPLHQPIDILQQLSLPPQKDLDSLLSYAGETTRTRHSTEQNVLPPLLMSQSLSVNSKQASDAVEMSKNPTIFHGKRMKIKNSIALQRGTDDFLTGFDSLTFDKSLVPPLNVKPAQTEKEVASAVGVLPSTGMRSGLNIHADERSPTHAATRTLSEMTEEWLQTHAETVKSLGKLPRLMLRHGKLQLRPDRSIKLPRLKLRYRSEIPDNGHRSKMLKLSSSDIRGAGDVPTHQTESAREASLHCSGSSYSSSVRSPGK